MLCELEHALGAGPAGSCELPNIAIRPMLLVEACTGVDLLENESAEPTRSKRIAKPAVDGHSSMFTFVALGDQEPASIHHVLKSDLSSWGPAGNAPLQLGVECLASVQHFDVEGFFLPSAIRCQASTCLSCDPKVTLATAALDVSHT